MRKLTFCAILGLLMTSGLALLSGCSKKRVVSPASTVSVPQETESAAPPRPSITMTISPATVNKGESTTLSWTSGNATSVTIDGNIGNVEPAGEREITPPASTTFTATAHGPGGTAAASARITVIEGTGVTPLPLRTLSDSEFFAERVSDIFFDFDKYNLRGDALETLDRNAIALNERDRIRVIIEGHCDERGSEKYNLALGDRRAQAAKHYLVSKGIAAGRLDTISYGEERPFEPGHGEQAWAKNRRAHFVIVDDALSSINSPK